MTERFSQMSRNGLRLGLVAEQPLLRSALSSMLREAFRARSAPLGAVHAACSLDALDAADTPLDVIVIDLTHRLDPGTRTAVLERALRSRIVVICHGQEVWEAPALFTDGVHGVTSDQVEAGAVAQAVVAVANGSVFFCESVTRALRHGFRVDRQPSRPAGLTSREHQLVRCVAHGLTHRQAAAALGLTEETVNTYVKRIRGKLHVGNKADLVLRAVELGYVNVEVPDNCRDARTPSAASVTRSGSLGLTPGQRQPRQL